MQRIIPHIWFETQARDAALYKGIFADSLIHFEMTFSGTPSPKAGKKSADVSGL